VISGSAVVAPFTSGEGSDDCGAPRMAAAGRGRSVPVMKDEDAVTRIDVGFDGSREAAAALMTAARLARSLEARLRLVAVAERRFDLTGRPLSGPGELERLERHLAQAIVALDGLAVETELREGSPDEVIRALARESDLLVLGSRASYCASGHTSLGTIAARVMKRSPIPTLIVPTP
jgi:nucleotide-binding universal stress UspA family protein